MMNMKNKILLFAALIGTMGFSSCGDFLDEEPDISGSAYIYHMDQLYGMMGSLDLYLSAEPEYVYGGSYWGELPTFGDLVEYTPEYYVLGLGSGEAQQYNIYTYSAGELEDQNMMGMTWTPSWDRIYRFNTVLENLDNVVQITPAIHDQVKGEAYFGRAYYHFILLVQYCLWNEDEPGIGYRDNTMPNEVPARQTVGYTLERIYEDLDSAQMALTRAGRTVFDFEHNYRPTVPTVQAFRARVDLYRGNYQSALRNATDALAAHSTLVVFKDDPLYALEPYDNIYVLDENLNVTETISAQILWELMAYNTEAVADYKELFLPNLTREYPWNPISEYFYNLWDRENDARWIYFYSGYTPLFSALYAMETVELPSGEILDGCITAETQKWLKPWNCFSHSRFYCGGYASILGMTTAEMYLIKAECEARLGTGDPAETLKTLRRSRFMTQEAADDVDGTVQDVIDERAREMGSVWRFFDIKRLNGAENAGIHIRREILDTPTDLSTRRMLDIAPDDPRWALPINPQEVSRMGWEQNRGWE